MNFNKVAVHVKSSGFFTTVQDKGRIGFQEFGMPVAGAMDQDSYAVGQALVGNDTYLGALECTLLPPTLEVESHCIVAFTGADMNPTINGMPVPLYIPFLCRPGDEISGAYVTEGMRMYISFRGGIDVPIINDSVSTHTKARIGGYEGRHLMAGDTFYIHCSFENLAERETFVLEKGDGLSNTAIEPYTVDDFRHPIRIVLGPQHEAFTDTGIQTFAQEYYEITPQCDRMGIRLSGPVIEHVETADIISDGAVFGSIQVPADGQPIVLMADRQTTGGYTKIGTVISPDLPRLSQIPIGHALRFKIITVEEAQEQYRSYRKRLDKILQVAKGQSVYVFTV